MNYSKKVAFISGGSEGFGLALAKELARRGADLLLIARRPKVLEEARSAVKAVCASPSQRIEVASLDVADAEGVKRELSKRMKEMGVPDIVANCAGFAHPARFEETSNEVFRSIIDVNLGGTWNVLQAVVPEMKKRGSGQILNVSSVAGFIGVYGYTGYGAAKFAVCGLSEVLRSELKPHNVSVHVLYPPDMDTPGYVEESKTKPPETKAVEGNVKIQKPEQVARLAIRGLERGKFDILSGYPSFIRFVNGISPALVRSFTDSDVKKAQKTVGKN